MNTLKKIWHRFTRAWFKVPRSIRRPIVLVVGILMIILAGLTGPLPGPGGVPLFLLAIALLSTEFERAKIIRDWVLDIIKHIGEWWRRHKVVGTLVFVLCGVIAISIGFVGYRLFNHQSISIL